MIPDWLKSVHHDGSGRYVQGRPTLGGNVRVRVRAHRDAPIEAITLRTCPDGEQSLGVIREAGVDSICRWWEADLRLVNRRTTYRFRIHSSAGSWWLTAGGCTLGTPLDATDFCVLADFNGAPWVQQSIFYQIFPDRFASSGTKHPDPFEKVRKAVARAWNDVPRPHSQTGGVEFFGGDLAGVVPRLEHLQSLGVNALYFTPIFTAPSNHRYDTADFRNVDPRLGGNSALVQLAGALKRYDMRYILDIVLNHCGARHEWFLQAQQDASAETAEFFTFHRHPRDYASWLGHKSLPKLNYHSEKLRRWMWEAPDAILRQWLRPPYGAAGWRIDVANMLGKQGETWLGHKMGRAIRRCIKAEFPEAYLLGEHFHDGTPHLQGNELDAAMNYRGFLFPVLHWWCQFDTDVAEGPKSPLSGVGAAEQVTRFMAAVPWQIAIQQFNLLGSHDLPRLFTIAGEDAAVHAALATLLMGFVGVPCIYYGDEVGLAGGRDPDNRRPMPWDGPWPDTLLSHYQRLGRLRRSCVALQSGGFQWLDTSPRHWSFLRDHESGAAVVVAVSAGGRITSVPVSHGGISDGTLFRIWDSATTIRVSNGHLPLKLTGPATTILLQAT